MRGISLSKLSISQIYGLSGSVYQENLGKLLLPALIPTLLLVGVSVIFYVTTLPTLVIEDISQYYSFSSYQALDNILGTWYDIFIAALVAYAVLMLYAFSVISGIVSDGLMAGSLSIDVGARRGTAGFFHALIPALVILAAAYSLLSSYGRLSIIVPLVIGYLCTYLVSASVVDGAFVGKNVVRSVIASLRNPIFTLVVFVVPLALLTLGGGLALWAGITYLPAFLFVVAAFVLMFIIPYAALINTIAYLSLKA